MNRIGSVPVLRQQGTKTEKPKDAWRTLTRIFSYMGRQGWVLLLLMLLVLFNGVLLLAVPLLQKEAIDAIVSGTASDWARLKFYLMLMGIVFFMTSGLYLVQEFFSVSVSQRAVQRMRDDMMKRMMALPVKYFDTHTHGELMSRLTNDADNISACLSQNFSAFISGVIGILGSLSMMIYYNRLMTLISLATIPAGIYLTNKISAKTRMYFRKQQKELGHLNGHIEEMIIGQKTVIAFNRQALSMRKFNGINERLRKHSIWAQIFSGIIFPFMNTLGNLSFVCVAISGGILMMLKDSIADNALIAVLCGSISIGTIQLFINLSKQFTRPVNELANQFNLIQSAVAGAERMFEVMDQATESDCGKLCISGAKGDIAFNDISFGYNPETLVLKNFSISCRAGQKIALAGPTGAGKTTIANLLMGFYEINSGSIYIDGVNIQNIKKSSLRRMIGIVLQDTILFSGTIRDNIRYGSSEVSDEEIHKAAISANAHGFISRLKDGYDTEVSEAGGNLSHGQRQLISIARTILADPKILILDEATSNVDTKTEMQIQQAMQNLMKNKTCFIIAHRLSTVRNADTILVIRHGQIAEMGNHDALMEKKGEYYSLYQTQFTECSL
ncbi:MAG: ABC transporter ATP-binding protein/permease [Oscillospiraceae bacterium]|nr:ABC transporter ATP-binding protein/permease [Oscillospiraceae bacterium]